MPKVIIQVEILVFHQARAADREAAIAERRVSALEDRTRVELRQVLAERISIQLMLYVETTVPKLGLF